MVSNWHPEGARDFINIEALDVECIIGLYEHERTTPQRLVVEVSMALDVERAAESERLDATVDYEWVSTQIAFLLKVGRFRLLETAALTICRALLLPAVEGEARGNIQAVNIVVRKPGALLGRGVPHLRMVREARDVQTAHEAKPFGTVDIIHETPDVGFYRLNVLPEREIELHVHHRMEESELVLSSGLHCQGEPAARGTVRQWPRGLAHHYYNPTQQVQSLLCIDRPPFHESDEIPIAGTAAAFAAERVWDL
ncbi:MAG TPA: dihydroneopterin aldolase [Polyangiaceae bacterium]|nr:dihydroneopterin aldolase [Polyangiaceae bacterium]